MATQGDIKPLGQYVVERVASSSTPKTISANSTGGSLDFPIAKTGTPLIFANLQIWGHSFMI